MTCTIRAAVTVIREKEAVKRAADTSGCSLPSLSPALLFPALKESQGRDKYKDRTVWSHMWESHNHLEQLLGSWDPSVRLNRGKLRDLHSKRTAVFPRTQTHMADKLRSSASCLMLHFCLHLCCACRWALTPSPLSE